MIKCFGRRPSPPNRTDGKQVGAASAVLYHKGEEYCHLKMALGETITETDTLIRSLTPALESLTLFLTAEPDQVHIPVNVCIPSGAALTKTLDASPHEEQKVALSHLTTLGELLTNYPSLQIRLQWLPRKGPSVGLRRAKQLALEAIQTADLTALVEPVTIRQQKEQTKVKAMSVLTERWHQNPRTSHAYRTALREPPNGKHHPTFQPTPKNPQRETNSKVKFSRLTHSTLYRFITGHAFIREYTQRFYSRHTPDQVACPCGSPIQTVEHVLMDCPLHTAARHRHLFANGRPRVFHQLFNHPECVLDVLRFLEETSACAKPRASWEPG